MTELVSASYVTDDIWAVVFSDGGIATIGLSASIAKREYITEVYGKEQITNSRIMELWPTVVREKRVHLVQLNSTYMVNHEIK